jgi:ribose transport system permease protein
MTTADPTASHRLMRLLAKLGPFIALITLMVVFRLAIGEGATGRTFWSADNLRLMLSQTTIVAVAACGMTMIIVAGGIDLSVGSVMAVSSVTAGLTLAAGYDPALALLVALLAGALCGGITGGIIAGTGISPFIVTLGMMGVARGTAKGLANEEVVRFPKSWVNGLMHPIPSTSEFTVFNWMVVAPGIWIAALLALVMALVMRRTVFGRNCYAIGSNESASRLCGVRVRTSKVLIYVLAGAIFGLAGLLDLSRLAQGNPTTGLGVELDVIAAVVIGGASLAGGTGTITGTIIGALIMGVLRAGTTQMNWPTWVQEILIGAIIVLAVGIDRLRNRRTG